MFSYSKRRNSSRLLYKHIYSRFANINSIFNININFEKIEPNPRTKKRATKNKKCSKLLNLTLNLTNLNLEERESLHKVLNKFPYQFYLKGDKLGSTNILKHTINTINVDPVRNSCRISRKGM